MGRGVTKHSSMQDWLKSKAPGTGGGGGKFLTGWKKKPGHVDTWLHMKTLPMTVWQHNLPIFVVVDDKETKEKVTHVWARKHTCHETEEVLEAMYFRETKGDPASPRKHPPKRCAVCKFNEWLWQQCWAWLETHTWNADENKWAETKKGKGRGLNPCAALFKLEGDDPKESVVVHVGGACGLFGRKELPDDLEAAMKARKISPREAWKESFVVKPQSVMCVVDNDNPGNGVQISTETKELGEKVKDEIVRVMKSQEIDIQRTPYCIRWEFDEKANMGKMYSATALMKVKPTDRVLKLIKGEAPDLSSIETPFNHKMLRSFWEQHCLVKSVPWDEFFPTPAQEKEWDAEDEESEEDDASSDDEDDDTSSSDDEDDDSSDDDDDEDASSDDDSDDEDDEVACDECGKAMKASDEKCPHCGHSYVESSGDDEEEEEAPAPPPKKLKTRAELAAEKAAAAKKPGTKKADAKTTKKQVEREPGDDTDEIEADNQDDSIPF